MAMMDGNDRRETGGDWWSEHAPPPAAPVPTSTYGTPPPFFSGSTPPFAPGHGWADAGPQRDPQGHLWTWNPGTNAWEQQAAATVKNPDPITPNPNPTQAPPPIGVPTSGFGAAPPVYASNPDAPVYQPMATYVPPMWTGGDFVNPTEAELLASPGYQARLDTLIKGKTRGYAAQGTALNGGTLVALDRAGQDYASNEYQTLRNNSYDAYVQKYRQFTDAAGMDLAARTANANENQNTFANRTTTFNSGNARTLSDFLTNTTAKRNSELDYWNRLSDLSGTGASLAGGSR